MLRSPIFRAYLLGLSWTVLGAWGVELTGSMIPLALGGSLTVMQTAATVRAILRRRRRP
jgi:hypothetical protein